MFLEQQCIQNIMLHILHILLSILIELALCKKKKRKEKKSYQVFPDCEDTDVKWERLKVSLAASLMSWGH